MSAASFLHDKGALSFSPAEPFRGPAIVFVFGVARTT